MTPQTLKTVRAYALLNDDDNESALPQDDILVMPDQISYDKEKLTITIAGVTFRTKNPRLTFARALSAFDNIDLLTEYDGKNLVLNRVPDTTVNLGCYNVIGGPGFGYEKDEDNSCYMIPHLGGVIIEENVKIHNFVNIDRGVIGDTIIREGVKIDSHVHIAHGAEIGENTLIVAHAVIGGSCKIGKNCYIGMGAMIKNKVTIGDGATVGMGAVVTKDVPPGATVVGNPAYILRGKKPECVYDACDNDECYGKDKCTANTKKP